jgi:hypothetical protein
MGLDTDLWDLARDYWIGRSWHSWLDAQLYQESDMRNGLQPSEGDAAFPYFDGIPGGFIIRAVSLIQRRMRMYIRMFIREAAIPIKTLKRYRSGMLLK